MDLAIVLQSYEKIFYICTCANLSMQMNIPKQLAAAALALCLAVSASAASKSYGLSSPDGRITAEIVTGDGVNWSVSFNGKQLITPSAISMTFADGSVWGGNDKVRKSKSGKVEELGISSPFYKKSSVDNVYNYLTLSFKGYDIQFRAFNDGVAYRFVSTAKAGELTVTDELTEFNFAGDWPAWISYVKGEENPETIQEQFVSSFENTYQHLPLSQWNTKRIAFMPLLVEADGAQILITESDLRNYPGTLLTSDGSTGLKGVRAPYPTDLAPSGVYLYRPMTYADYLSKVPAGQEFPWKVIGIVPEATDLLTTDLVWLLAKPADPETDWNWVKPGKVAWDWWNDWNLHGVDFRSGINTATYKFYIDFAAANGIEYVIFDEGWAQQGKANLFLINPDMDLDGLFSYAKEKGVGIILWASYNSLVKDIEKAFKHYSEKGVKGFKVDFINRDDQQAVKFCEEVAATAAKYRLMVDFHGIYKPTGLNRTYPNVVCYEGVAGLEQMKWSDESFDMVTHDVTLPFIRMVAGPMDYTQGAMRNVTRNNYHPNNSEPMSQGTRCRQLAEYAIFEAPLTMLCDTPTNYMDNQECTDFIAGIPTVWDETVPLCGKTGEYVAVARRNGDKWYIGALTNWDARELELNLGFIKGRGMTVFQDGINAYRTARDYKKVISAFPADGKVKISMAPGGGWAAIVD